MKSSANRLFVQHHIQSTTKKTQLQRPIMQKAFRCHNGVMFDKQMYKLFTNNWISIPCKVLHWLRYSWDRSAPCKNMITIIVIAEENMSRGRLWVLYWKACVLWGYSWVWQFTSEIYIESFSLIYLETRCFINISPLFEGFVSISDGNLFIWFYQKSMPVSHAFQMNDITGVALFVYHIEAETKWSPFRRRHFEMHFSEWKCINFDRDFTDIVPRVQLTIFHHWFR